MERNTIVNNRVSTFYRVNFFLDIYEGKKKRKNKKLLYAYVILPNVLSVYKGGAGRNEAILQGVLIPGDKQRSTADRWRFPFI